jgi:hypothetical protein
MTNWDLYVERLAAKRGLSVDDAEQYARDQYEADRAATLNWRYSVEDVERADYEHDQQKYG